MHAAEIASEIPLDILMERAGTALADAAIRLGRGQPVLVLCGPGNNGGDGYVAARVLQTRLIDVRVAAHAPPKSELGVAARLNWSGPVERLGDTNPAPILLDCLFGTGLTRPLDDDYALPLRRLKEQAQFTIAADLPSGVDTDHGTALGAAGADVTLAFATAKPAHLLQPAARYCGRVLIADIGVIAQSTVRVLARPRLASPGPDDHKYTRGMVAVISGDMAGAGLLAAGAAARIAGYTILSGKGECALSIVRRDATPILSDEKIDAVLIGPGMDNIEANRTTVFAALAERMPLVLDAGALALVTAQQLRRTRTDRVIPAAHRFPETTVITPHEGEFVRLFGRLPGSKVERARSASALSNSTVIYKGADTVVASPDGQVTIATGGSHWLASAGTGDVLAGIVLGMLGRGLGAHDAACAAVWVHGEAARRAGPGLIADDLHDHIAGALQATLV